MKVATVKEIRQELSNLPTKELIDVCLRLSKFKKENKELLTYLLYEVSDEASYVKSVKTAIDQEFEAINKTSYYFIKKSIRKILRNVKKHIRYSQKKETEVELLLYFCTKLRALSPPITRNKVLQNLYARQVELIKKSIGTLHEDLQYDFEMELQGLI